MKRKIIHITCCGHCPYSSLELKQAMLTEWTELKCKKTGEEITEPYKILITCPLQDYECQLVD